jgi:membrane protein implicated in regulation of membrane protease activity
MPMWLIWFLLGTMLVVFEAVIAFTLYAGAIALGAYPAAVVAAAGGSLELQVAVFSAGAAFSLVVIRPLARRHLMTPPSIRTGTENLIGAQATVLERVDDDTGLVKIRGGDVWSARSHDPNAAYEAQTQVRVRAVRGVAVLVEALSADAEAADAEAAVE